MSLAFARSYLSQAVGDMGIVLALDIERGMIRYMTERAAREGWRNVKAVVVPANDPKLESNSADRILVVNTWHHIRDRKAYAAKLNSALVRGGMVFIVDFTLESAKGPPREERLPPKQVKAELHSGGLEAQILEELLPDQYMVSGRKP